jgi:EF-hand domain pair
LFPTVQDSVEGIAYGSRIYGLGPSQKRKYTKEYQLLLEREIFDKYDISRTGVLSFDEFRSLILATVASSSSSSSSLSEKEINFLWTKFDRLKDGVIHFEEEFAGRFGTIEDLLLSIQNTDNDDCHDTELGTLRRLFRKIGSNLKTTVAPLQLMWQNEDRIYFVFVGWVVLGVTWGVMDQGWDVITATHFAVSALATVSC